MPEYDIDVLVQLGVDRNQAERVLSQVEKTESAIQQIGNAIRTAMEKDGSRAVNKAIKDFEALRKKIFESENAVKRYNDEFDRVSRDVGLAGDVQSNLGAFSALLHAGGQSELAGAVQLFGELSAGVEEIARFKTAITGFPATVGAALQAVGPAGIAAAAGIGVATAAFAVLDEQARKNAEAYTRAGEAVRELNRDIESGELTTEEAIRRREDLTNQQAAETRTLDMLQRTYDEYIAQKGVLGAAVKLTAREEEALVEQIGLSRKALEGYEQDLNGLNAVIDSGILAANDAAVALEKYNDELLEQRALVDNVLIDGLNTLDNAYGQTAEQIQEQIDGINRRKELIDQLLASEQLSADAAEDLRNELGLLNSRLILLSDVALKAAQDMDAAAAAAEDAQRQQDETIAATKKFNSDIVKLAQDVSNERLKVENDYADKILDLTRKYNDDLEDATIDLGRGLSDIITDAGRDTDQAARQAREDRIRDEIEFNNETKKQARDLQRELLQIRDDSATEEENLIRSRDFAGLRELRRERNRALDDAVDSFNDEQREREIAFREQQELTNRQLKFEAETRRIRFEQQIDDARLAYNRQQEDLNRNLRRQQQTLLESRDRQLDIIADTERNKLNLIAQAYQTELRLAAQSAQQRIALQEQVNQALLAQAQAFRLASGLFGGNSGGNSITQTFQQTFTSGGTPQQNVALAGIVAAEVGRQIRNYLG